MSKTTKRRVLALRERGHSMSAISRRLGISKSIVSYWVTKEKHVLAPEHVAKLMSKRDMARKKGLRTIKLKWRKYRQAAETEAQSEWTEVAKSPFFMAMLGLYLGEGDKTKSALGLCNMDLSALAMFKIWGEKFLGVVEWSCQFVTYDEGRISEQESALLGLFGRNIRFQKATVKNVPTKNGFNLGVVRLRAHKSARALYKVLMWIRMLKSSSLA